MFQKRPLSLKKERGEYTRAKNSMNLDKMFIKVYRLILYLFPRAANSLSNNVGISIYGSLVWRHYIYTSIERRRERERER